MKIAKNKTKASVVTLVLALTIAVSLFALPTATAQDRVNPYPYINAVPNPVTVATPTLLHVGSIYPLPWEMAPGWTDLSVEITRPDNTTETLSGIDTDLTGGTGIQYTPSMVGTYKLRTHFPETVTTAASGRWGANGTIMEEAWSETLDLVVLEEQIPYYPGHPLPTEYWTRPIGGQLREWNVIAGNWLMYVPPTNPDPPSYRQPFNEDAPESAHILFRKPLTMGGLAGGETGEHGFEQGDAYEPKFGGGGLFGARGPVIIGGVIFYMQHETTGGDSVEQVCVAVDLHTGEELWRRPLTLPDGTVVQLAFGQQFYWDSYNYHGVFPYLWATTGFFVQSWHAFDAFSGRWEYTMENVPPGTMLFGPKGEIFKINVNANTGEVSFWNSSRVVADHGSWRPHGNVFNCSLGAARNGGTEWISNVTQLIGLPGSAYKYRDGIVVGADFQRGALAPNPATIWAIAIEEDGARFMWDTTWALPQDKMHITVEDVSVEDDLIIHSSKETRQTWGRRLSTGQLIWGPTPMRDYLDTWGHSSGNSWDLVYEGKVIAGNYGGTVWCYDAQNGTVLWTFDIEDPYTEILHNVRWRFRPVIITDGKLYIENTEHNPRDPQPRGAPFICLDLETGEEIWRLPYRAGEWSSTAVIGDSIVVIQNTYDQHFYVVGKGPSAITVTASPKVSAHGSSVVIEGMVTDVSPGTKEYGLTARFPNGVPAVSDESMTDWMTYVYNQFPIPADVTGVEISLDTLDPNGNFVHIGVVTSDMYGMFKKMFTPEVPGEYTIIATFMGSKSYYASYAETAIGVGPAPEEPPEYGTDEWPAYPEAPAYTAIDLALIVAVVVAILIGIVNLWALRRK